MSVYALRRTSCRHDRSGEAVVLLALLLMPMVAMVAFAVDYGYLLKIETDLQRFADAASLAAVQDLIPADDGTQDLDSVRAAVRTYVSSNFDASFQVLDSDIEIGPYDPATIYTTVNLLNTGIYDTVRLTVRRDDQANAHIEGVDGSHEVWRFCESEEQLSRFTFLNSRNKATDGRGISISRSKGQIVTGKR